MWYNLIKYGGKDMLSEKDKLTILKCAEKYDLDKVVLFGSSIKRTDTNDIDLGVKGLSPDLFFRFCWELYHDLSKHLKGRV
jgi:predicted nucleotidyltransferase